MKFGFQDQEKAKIKIKIKKKPRNNLQGVLFSLLWVPKMPKNVLNYFLHLFKFMNYDEVWFSRSRKSQDQDQDQEKAKEKSTGCPF